MKPKGVGMSTCSPVSAEQVAVIEKQRDKYPKGIRLIEGMCKHIHEHRGNGVLHKHRKISERNIVGRQLARVLNNTRARTAIEAQQDLAITFTNCNDYKIVVVAVNKFIAKQAVHELCEGKAQEEG